MLKKQKHSKQSPDLCRETLEMISGTYISWGKNKEQVWMELEKKMGSLQSVRTKVIMGPWLKVAMAATFALLIGIPAVMQFYTKTISIPAGQHSTIYLPDQTQVSLNAESDLSYKPLLYKFSRNIKFEGEAFFEVKSGKKFRVNSENGQTIVLGTSFNIYSRNEEYTVTCVAGQVKVMEKRYQKEVVLQPGQKAGLNPEGILEVQSDINAEQTLSWINNRFSFTSVPLSKVFDEISRQYGIHISVPENIDNTYTGTFNKSTSVENILNLVCKPFNLKFTRKSKNEYIISSSN